jgi:hypothetical protein
MVFSELTNFLIKHSSKNFKDDVITHTRIGSKEDNLYGGSYVIKPDELNEFYKLYYEAVFVRGEKEYLTEVQPHSNNHTGNDKTSPIYVDLDFRYDMSITNRQHNKHTIDNIVFAYCEIFKDIFVFNGSPTFDIFVFQKDKVNIVEDKNITKDGIHMLFDLKADHITNQILRQKIIDKCVEDGIFSSLPLVNSLDDIFDEGISKKKTNCQMYGSQKPHNEPYKLTNHYSVEVDADDGEFMFNELDVKDFDLKSNFYKLSVQNQFSCAFPITDKFDKEHKSFLENSKNKKTTRNHILNKKNEMNCETDTESISDLGDMDLTKYEDMGDIDLQLSILEPCFQKGQYNNWMKIGCILKKTLPYEDAVSYFIEHSYIAPFDNEADKQKNINMFNSWNTNNGYTKKSLMKMCKDINKDLTFKLFPYENFNGYVKDATDVSQLVEKIQDTIIRNTRFDGIKWYCLIDNNLWLIADPETNITKEVLRYIDYNKNYIDELFRFTDSPQEKKIFTNELTALLKFRTSITNSTSITNKIKKMLSSKILDKNFALNLDSKKDIWAFKNGVLNLKNGAFRRGFRSDDYLTTHLDFDYNKKFDETKLANLKEQFKKVLNYNDEHLNYFMSIIGACMTGNADKLKEMYFGVDGCDGIGNNGKTNTLTIFNMIFNCYIYKTNKTFLEASNTKSHKQLVMMKGKRIVWADEWGKGLPNYELLKITADGTNCENEVMYGTSEGILIMFKMFILTNHTPNLSSDEDAVYNRFRQITFGSHFDTQGITIEENYEKLQFIADVNMRDNIVNNYKNEMIAWVLEYSKKFLIDYKLPPIPEKFVNDTKETKNANDKFKTIIDEYYERCDVDDENEYVSMYELMDRSGIKNNKTIISKMKQIGFPTRYDKNKMKNRKKGIFYGIKEKIDEE